MYLNNKDNTLWHNHTSSSSSGGGGDGALQAVHL